MAKFQVQRRFHAKFSWNDQDVEDCSQSWVFWTMHTQKLDSPALCLPYNPPKCFDWLNRLSAHLLIINFTNLPIIHKCMDHPITQQHFPIKQWPFRGPVSDTTILPYPMAESTCRKFPQRS